MSERDRETASRPASDDAGLSSTLPSDGPAPPRRSQACERCWTRKQRVRTMSNPKRRSVRTKTYGSATGFSRVAPAARGSEWNVSPGFRLKIQHLERRCSHKPRSIGKRRASWSYLDGWLWLRSIRHPDWFISYIESLESNARHGRNPPSINPPSIGKSHRMEASIQEVSHGHARSGSTTTSGGLSPANPDNDAASENASSIDDTMGAIGLLTNSAMAEPRPGNRQPPDRLGLLHSVQAALAIDGHDPSTSKPLRSTTLFDWRQDLLPTRDDAKVFFRCYLEDVYFLPCLAGEDVDSLLSSFDTIKPSQLPSADGDTSHALRSFDTYIQIAIGMMVSPNSIRLSNHAVALQVAAVRLLPAVLRSRSHIDTVHCLVLLIAFAMFNPNGGSVWHLVGLALRTCITAGLHKESGSQSALTSQETEDGRWLFWSVYSLDR